MHLSKVGFGFFCAFLLTFHPVLSNAERIDVINGTMEVIEVKLCDGESVGELWGGYPEMEIQELKPSNSSLSLDNRGRLNASSVFIAYINKSIAEFDRLSPGKYFLKVRVGKDSGLGACFGCRYYQSPLISLLPDDFVDVNIMITSTENGLSSNLLPSGQFAPISESEY